MKKFRNTFEAQLSHTQPKIINIVTGPAGTLFGLDEDGNTWVASYETTEKKWRWRVHIDHYLRRITND